MTGGDRGQATVLGNVLLVGLAVLVVGTVAVAAIYPAVQSGGEPLVDTDVSASTVQVRITHAGGDALPSNELRVYLDPGATDGLDFEVDFPGARFEPTDTWSYSGVAYEYGTNARVVLVHEPSGSILTDEHVVVERPQVLVAAFSFAPEAPKTNRTVSFDAARSTDPKGTVEHYEWAFGDGTTVNTTDPTVTHTYADDGDYEVNLTVTNDDAERDAVVRTVAVRNRRPVPRFGYAGPGTGAGSVLVGETVAYDGTNSSDPDGTITAHEWAFGDGAGAAGATASHAFDSPGTYDTSLTVTDDDGATNRTAVPVRVYGRTPAPGIAYRTPNAGDTRTVDAVGRRAAYRGEPAKAFGPMTHDLDGDGRVELPYLNQTGHLNAVDAANGTTVLFDPANHGYDLKASGVRLGAGDWSGDGTPSVFAVTGNGKLLRANATGVARVVDRPAKTNPQGKVTRSATYVDAAAVAGVADFNGDGDRDVVVSTSNGKVGYVEDDGKGGNDVQDTTAKLNSAEALGAPADLDGDGAPEVPYHAGKRPLLRYADAGGEEAAVTAGSSTAQETSLATFDYAGDGTPEVVFIDGAGRLRYATVNGTVGFVVDEDGYRIAAGTTPGVA